jgi:hypothetical protein
MTLPPVSYSKSCSTSSAFDREEEKYFPRKRNHMKKYIAGEK